MIMELNATELNFVYFKMDSDDASKSWMKTLRYKKGYFILNSLA